MPRKVSMIVGDIFTSKHGGDFEVIEYNSSKDVVVMFLDEDQAEVRCQAYAIRLGTIKNPYTRGINGVGYVGVGPYKSNSLVAKRHWGLFHRSTSESAYEGYAVDVSFHSRQDFGAWFTAYGDPTWEVDKDLLNIGNKVYGVDTCVLLPKELNLALAIQPSPHSGLPHGVKVNHKGGFDANHAGRYLGHHKSPAVLFLLYKYVKESNLRDLANKYVDKLDPRAYTALMNYKVHPYNE